MKSLIRSGALASALLLAACSGSTSSGTAESTKEFSAAQMLAQVRAAGQIGNELDVQPLRDAQVEDLRAVAALAENNGDIGAAQNALEQALRVVPEDPDLLQWQAELALLGRDWEKAETLAMSSYQKGPKLGGLCRRSWATIQFAREARGDAFNSLLAQQNIANCTVAPPVRM